MITRVSIVLIVGAATCIVSPVGLAQERQIGGAGLTVFTEHNFRGRSATIRVDTPNFQAIGLNDLISSLQVALGEQWEVCEDINYHGRCAVVSSSEADLRRSGWNDTISSARRVRGAIAPPVSTLPAPVQPLPFGLELFSREGYAGARRAFTGAQSDLRKQGFNDAARSLRIGRRETWEICTEPNFVNCIMVNSDWTDLSRLGMSRQISSVRPWRPDAGSRVGSVRPVPTQR